METKKNPPEAYSLPRKAFSPKWQKEQKEKQCNRNWDFRGTGLLSLLPPPFPLETVRVLKQAIASHRALAELKGVSKTIPKEIILINTLPLLEAKESSAIENIITTHDELYKESLFENILQNKGAKEVQNYSRALKIGFAGIKEKGLFLNSQILEIQEVIEKNSAGFRKLPGTDLRNSITGEIIYIPPQGASEIIHLMENLQKYINDDTFQNIDPLIKMAVIHFQFESIHPFYDGNGRTGRIINILYLVYKGLLDIPVLYLSRYIIQHKKEYYRLLQDVRVNAIWEEWILFMLKGVEETSIQTIHLINGIRKLMQDYKTRIRGQYKFYSQELLNNLFSHPYTKIEFIENDLKVHRQTASRYLEELVKGGFLEMEKIGKHHFFINRPLLNLFQGMSHDEK
jgi:Fic family protein